MTTDLPEENQGAADDLDWDNRILCSDGNCIGVIGADGRCKECGKTYEGELPETDIPDPEDQPVTEDEDPAIAAAETQPTENESVSEEWENRVLCSDGNCIGIIGPDGNCKECGKPLD
jgi:hypothetical protein